MNSIIFYLGNIQKEKIHFFLKVNFYLNMDSHLGMLLIQYLRRRIFSFL